jgi:hypothetical protein
MKTKDFIKMLQEADPSGESYVRLPYGGAVVSAEPKEGYWDGAYSYYDYETNKMHTTTLGSKVDIHVINYYDIIEQENGNFDKVKERIVLDHSNFSFKEQQDEKDNSIWNSIREDCEFTKNIWSSIREDCEFTKIYDDKFLEEWYKKVLDEYYDNDMEIRQPIETRIGAYNTMKAYSFDGTPIKLNQGECDIIIRSGKFYPIEKDTYYLWLHDPEKGKDWSFD